MTAGVTLTAGLGVFVACGLVPPWEPLEEPAAGDSETGDDQTYFMGEQMDYSNLSVCQNTSLNDVTSDFQATLDAAGWSGHRLEDADSKMSDFYDTNIQPIGYGKDHLHADAARVAVFAGHGHVGIHAWGRTDPDVDECRVRTNSYALGRMSGDETSLFISASSCNGAIAENSNDFTTCFDHTWTLGEFRQWLGFMDSPHIDSWGLTTFYQSLPDDDMSASGHVDTWIEVMEWPEAMVHNYPVVYTKVDDYERGTGFDELVHYEMNMKTGRHMSNNPEPKFNIVMSPTVGSDYADLAAMCGGGMTC